uniref:Uncharacterized protein n=1 Tax=Caenorhabditis japonica TaxID=281687 RepID=A0A8R1IQI1_CAEJA
MLTRNGATWGGPLSSLWSIGGARSRLRADGDVLVIRLSLKVIGLSEKVLRALFPYKRDSCIRSMGPK